MKLTRKVRPGYLNTSKIACLLALVTMLSCNNESDDSKPEAASRKPNIIVILSDDAGYIDFGCYGGEQIPTPNIDAISANGVQFSDAYVTASVCAPSRAGLITGRYQQRFGFEQNPSGEPAPGFTRADMGIDPDQTTMASMLKDNGYRTLAVGKWHLGNEEKHYPLNRGFDAFYGFLAGHRSYFGYPGARSREEALMDNRQEVPEDSITYLTDMFTNRAIAFMEEKKEQPFFIYLAYNAVHTPMDAKKEDWNKFASIADTGRRTYAAMMSSLDQNVGRVLAALKKNGLEENTLIYFLNDNGGATTNFSDNGPLRGMKGSDWEGGLRVAMMMQWPGHVPAGAVYGHPVSSLDIFATSLAAAGGDTAALKNKDGVNLLPYINGTVKDVPHQALYWRRGVAAAVREGNWKLIRVETNPILLFDLKNDLSETKNVAEKNPAVVKHLLAKLSEWEKGLSAQHWGSSYGSKNLILKHRMNVIGREMERKYP